MSNGSPDADAGPAIEILLDDRPLIAVNKPAGILTQGPPEALCTVESLVRSALKKEQPDRSRIYLGVPHRLDRSVTGALLLSRNRKGAARLAEIFRDRRVEKSYWAVVEHAPSPREGELADGIVKVEGAAYAEVVPKGTPGSQEARLTYGVQREVAGGWLVEIHPWTGRFHQIRAQFAARGWPIVGDMLYGSTVPLTAEDADWMDDGSSAAVMPIALHAGRLDFPHPIRFDPMTVEAPFPDWWTRRGWRND